MIFSFVFKIVTVPVNVFPFILKATLASELTVIVEPADSDIPLKVPAKSATVI